MTKIEITVEAKSVEVEIEGEVKVVDLLRATIELEERIKNMLDSSSIKEEDVSETLGALLELVNRGKNGDKKDGDTSGPPVYPSFFKGHEFSKTEGR